jgi:serine/threonine protein kinase
MRPHAQPGNGALARSDALPVGAADHGVHPPPAPVGLVLRGRFELVEIIGRGGMSTVYRAVDRLKLRARFSEPEVAIKIVDAGDGMQNDAIELIHREARRVQEISHPNIVEVHDSDFDGHLHFIVMELMKGRTLAAALREREGKPLDRGEAFLLLSQVGSALALAHRRGVVHADLKPGNIFLCRDGSVKVFDFGLAQSGGLLARPQDEDSTIHYLNRVRALTPGFASLAMLRGEAPTPTDDIYGFGLLAYLLLTGRHPFDGKTAEEAEQAGLVAPRPAAFDGRRWRCLRSALEHDPRLRPDNVETLMKGLAGKNYGLVLRLPKLWFGAKRRDSRSVWAATVPSSPTMPENASWWLRRAFGSRSSLRSR